jgi:DNA-directed RNA polymerase subunit RPC12/RpoP
VARFEQTAQNGDEVKMVTDPQAAPDLECPGCGASQRLEIGATATVCQHCGTRVERSSASDEAFAELDIAEHLERVLKQAPHERSRGAQYPGCGA